MRIEIRPKTGRLEANVDLPPVELFFAPELFVGAKKSINV
jgi:hypothetical protein